MKKIFLIFCFACFVGVAPSFAQCETQTFKDICIKKIPEYFVFSKSYSLTKKETEHEILLTKLKAYIVIADSYRTKIEIYKDDGKGGRSLVKTGEGYASYISGTPGKYFLKFIFEEGEDIEQYCGAAVVAFLR
jgi:hypothetical protein